MRKTLAPRKGNLSAERRRRLLFELANLRDDLKATRRLKEMFADVLPDEKYLKALFGQYSIDFQQPQPTKDQMETQIHRSWVIPLRNWVRSIWLAQDSRTQVWLAHRLISAQMFVKGDLREESRPIWLSNLAFLNGMQRFDLESSTPFEECVWHLLDCANRLRYCQTPECPAPYFIAARRNQNYCSEECTKPRQREFQRQWWAQHGKAWRKQRTRKQNRQKRKGRST